MLKDQEEFYVVFNSENQPPWHSESSPSHFLLWDALDIPGNKYEVKLVNITMPRTVIPYSHVLVCITGLQYSYAYQRDKIPLLAVIPCQKGSAGWDSFQFTSDIYRPMEKSLGALEVYITDKNHKPVQFESDKPVNLTLHFRRMRNVDRQ